MIRIVLALLILAVQTPASAPPLQFVKIEPGTFQMGCSSGDTMCDPDENPSHQVKLTKAFEIGKFAGSHHSKTRQSEIALNLVSTILCVL